MIARQEWRNKHALQAVQGPGFSLSDWPQAEPQRGARQISGTPHQHTLQLRFPKLIAAQHSTPSCTETLRRQEISGFMQRKAAAADDVAFDRRACTHGATNCTHLRSSCPHPGQRRPQPKPGIPSKEERNSCSRQGGGGGGRSWHSWTMDAALRACQRAPMYALLALCVHVFVLVQLSDVMCERSRAMLVHGAAHAPASGSRFSWPKKYV